MEYENGTNFSIGATTDNLPPGVLYRVKATYKYGREDMDELSFDVGEIIQVIEYDDPEEQVNISLLDSYSICRQYSKFIQVKFFFNTLSLIEMKYCVQKLGSANGTSTR